MALYKSVLHHASNALPVWFLETIGVYVSQVNGCSYCYDHHLAGLRRLVDSERADQICVALGSSDLDATFTAAELAALLYARKLTETPGSIDEGFVASMRSAGLSDGEILEVNQVTAYFAYANRVVNGLGVSTVGDELGLSPADSDDLESWEHG